VLDLNSGNGVGAGARSRLPRPRRAARLALVAVASAAAFLWPARAGLAATVNVSTTEQLEAAVGAAAAGDTIVLAAGTYAPTSPLVVKDGLTIQGPQVEGPLGSPPGAVISGAGIDGAGTDDVFDVEPGATLTLSSVSVRLAASDGLAIDDAGTLVLQASELSQNNSASAVLVEMGASLTATNTTIAGNLGVGLDVFGSASLVNVTVGDNKLGGIFNEDGSQISLTNTLVVRNGDGSTWSHDCNASVDSSTSSFDDDGSCGTDTHGDVRVASLGLNGGPTATLALLAGSPAIGSGTTAGCPGVDQRGAPRLGTCDIGAYQYGANAPAPPPPAIIAAPPAGTAGQPGAGGATGTTPSSTAKPSTGTTTAQAAAARRKAKLAAAGAIAGRRGAVLPFALAGTAGKTTGLVAFTDKAARIRLRVTAFRSISIDALHGTATLSGVAVNLATGARITFRVTVASGRRGTFRIAVGHGYTRGGPLRSGKVSITA
jgi:hypothetical protein